MEGRWAQLALSARTHNAIDYTQVTRYDARSLLAEALVFRGLESELRGEIERERFQSEILGALRGEKNLPLAASKREHAEYTKLRMPWARKLEIEDMKKNLPGFAEYMSKFEKA